MQEPEISTLLASLREIADDRAPGIPAFDLALGDAGGGAGGALQPGGRRHRGAGGGGVPALPAGHVPLVLGGLLHFHMPPTLEGEAGAVTYPWPWWLVCSCPTVGGLISGMLVFTWAPEAEGHGTDAMIRAFHQGGGMIRGRVPLIKSVASIITIGTGGSAGQEGPIAQIGAGFGSYPGPGAQAALRASGGS